MMQKLLVVSLDHAKKGLKEKGEKRATSIDVNLEGGGGGGGGV